MVEPEQREIKISWDALNSIVDNIELDGQKSPISEVAKVLVFLLIDIGRKEGCKNILEQIEALK